MHRVGNDGGSASSNGNLLQGQESLIRYGRCQAENHGASATAVMIFFFFFKSTKIHIAIHVLNLPV